ncbi:threonine--tRNA ligase [Candidatus Similichlamydia laticola]|uniref:Threonine--tRNA ligase n=1 Tax=Candidatus Similichlamydia laticola TaxID=2170265 RepID=A0A369K998_9BACT|nr:threonine--tRNA ligase [Candidatus Similichlamydia laticola]RDB31161.1 Threonyl-tRNA synthetase [Candidatus Similichlamydia laticola]
MCKMTSPYIIEHEIQLDQLVREKGISHVFGALVNGEPVDWNIVVHPGDEVLFLDFSHPLGKKLFWHTSAHVLAQAVLRLWPKAKPAIGPAIEEGFFYDFGNLEISDKDLPLLEKEAKKICKESFQCIRQACSTPEEAQQLISSNPYKLDILSSLPREALVTFYQQGEFVDLCRGPHLPHLGWIGDIHFHKVSGAYWRGDASNTMLTRIYGISFPDTESLNRCLEEWEERKKRDHKVLGAQLQLFLLREEAPGIPFILPKGMWMWDRLVAHLQDCQSHFHYQQIRTPLLLDQTLWKRSGHWANYKQNMYLTQIDSRTFAIKPMSCPGAILFFASHLRSYKQLPFRVFEVGHVHRYEASGALSGLMRVRGFHQDDAHIFLSLEMVSQEVSNLLNLIRTVYSPFDLSYHFELSTKPDGEHVLGSSEEWDTSTRALEQALEGESFTVNPGDGAFYGPKIDVHIRDALGRTWQCATIQLDLFQGKNFGLEYVGQDGTRHIPVILHRAIYGSIERFLGILIEHFAGRFPLWINPNQICLLPISSKHVDRCLEIQEKLVKEGFRTEVFSEDETLPKRIRKAEISKFCYLILIGEREIEGNNLAVRDVKKKTSVYSVEDFINRLRHEIETKAIHPS